MRTSGLNVPTCHSFMGSECLCVCIVQNSLSATYAMYKLLFLCEMFNFKLFLQLQEPLYLDKCIVCSEADWEGYFEVQELASKDTFIFKVSV